MFIDHKHGLNILLSDCSSPVQGDGGASLRLPSFSPFIVVEEGEYAADASDCVSLERMLRATKRQGEGNPQCAPLSTSSLPPSNLFSHLDICLSSGGSPPLGE